MHKLKRIVLTALTLSTLLFSTIARAEIGAGFEAGVGVRALSFANNHVAAVNDLTATYWNPAALALLPVREFQAALDGVRVSGISEFSGRAITQFGSKESYIERVRLASLGYMTAIPTTQGGLTIAASFDRPFAFDDVTAFTYEDRYYHGYVDTVTMKGRRYGDLNRWTVAFGAQLTERISAGLSVSLLTGKETAPIFQETKSDGEIFDYYDVTFNNTYLGYALTGGFLYYPTDILKVGFRINTVMDLNVQEVQNIREEDGRTWNSRPIKGEAYIAPKVTLGASVKLPYLTAALDLRATMPYTFEMPSVDIPDHAQAKYYKLGAGIGVEVPLPMAPVLVRAGYSIDEYDLFPIIHKFDDEIGIDWDFGDGFSVGKNKHTLSFGGAVFSAGLGFEFTYAYQTWGVNHQSASGRLEQTYSNHRVATALIFRY